MLCANFSPELEVVKTRSWAFNGSLGVQQGFVEGCAWEKGCEQTTCDAMRA